jgi:Tol biopolymer transport system component
MSIKTAFACYFLVIFIILLTACEIPGVGGSPGAITAAPTKVNVSATSTPAVAMTAAARRTQTAASHDATITSFFATANVQLAILLTASAKLTQTAAPTRTITPTWWPTRTPFPITTPLPLVARKGLRVAYIIDGNLYVQDSGGQPVQLTHSGVDRMPLLSGDGEKVLFFHGSGKEQNRLFVINADGSQERLLVSGEILASLGLGYDQLAEISSWELVPGMHQLLFDTQEFDARSAADGNDWGHGTYFQRNRDLLMVNLDTAEIKRLNREPWGKLFDISPDGKLITDSFNIFDIHGNLIRNLIVPPLAWQVEGVHPHWVQNSSKLIILPPIKGDLDPQGVPEARTIWRYSLDGSPAVETRLSPAPMGNDSFAVSPDGNWVVYTYSYDPGITDPSVPDGVYLGNLRNGNVQLLGSASFYEWPVFYYWGPDSKHFIFADYRDTHLYMGSIQGDVTPLNAIGFFGWIDNDHYLYQNKDVVMRKIGDKEGVAVVALLKPLKDTDSSIDSAYFTYSYIKP